jgi:hypothetical protein
MADATWMIACLSAARSVTRSPAERGGAESGSARELAGMAPLNTIKAAADKPRVRHNLISTQPHIVYRVARQAGPRARSFFSPKRVCQCRWVSSRVVGGRPGETGEKWVQSKRRFENLSTKKRVNSRAIAKSEQGIAAVRKIRVTIMRTKCRQHEFLSIHIIVAGFNFLGKIYTNYPQK